MEQLVHHVFLSQPPGVKDHRATLFVIHPNADQAVPDPAQLIDHREGRNAFQDDRVLVQAEAFSPAAHEVELRSHSDNESQYM